jgi:hypothetical protein
MLSSRDSNIIPTRVVSSEYIGKHAFHYVCQGDLPISLQFNFFPEFFATFWFVKIFFHEKMAQIHQILKIKNPIHHIVMIIFIR